MQEMNAEEERELCSKTDFEVVFFIEKNKVSEKFIEKAQDMFRESCKRKGHVHPHDYFCVDSVCTWAEFMDTQGLYVVVGFSPNTNKANIFFGKTRDEVMRKAETFGKLETIMGIDLMESLLLKHNPFVTMMSK